MDIFEIVAQKNLVLIKQALKNIEDIDALEEEESGEPLLLYAIAKRIDLEELRFFVDYGFDLSVTTMHGMGFFDYIVSYGSLDMVKYAVEELSCDVNKTKRRSGFTPLMQVACYGLKDTVRYLVEKGADKDACDGSGMSVSDYARRTGHKKVVELLSSL